MHSKWRYKMCIYSVILRQLSLYELQKLEYYFPENFRCNLKFYESKDFSDSSIHLREFIR